MNVQHERLSSQIQVTIYNGMIIPITANISEEDNEDDPIFSIQCYTQDP